MPVRVMRLHVDLVIIRGRRGILPHPLLHRTSIHGLLLLLRQDYGLLRFLHRHQDHRLDLEVDLLRDHGHLTSIQDHRLALEVGLHTDLDLVDLPSILVHPLDLHPDLDPVDLPSILAHPLGLIQGPVDPEDPVDPADPEVVHHRHHRPPVILVVVVVRLNHDSHASLLSPCIRSIKTLPITVHGARVPLPLYGHTAWDVLSHPITFPIPTLHLLTNGLLNKRSVT